MGSTGLVSSTEDSVHMPASEQVVHIPRELAHSSQANIIAELEPSTWGGSDAQWLNGYPGFWTERCGFEPWPGPLCCVLGQDALLSQCLSLPRCINGYQQV